MSAVHDLESSITRPARSGSLVYGKRLSCAAAVPARWLSPLLLAGVSTVHGMYPFGNQSDIRAIERLSVRETSSDMA